MQLPTGEEKPSWAALFGAVPMVYLFLDPYQRGALWLEWTLTALALAAFGVLYFIAVLYWSRPRVVAIICAAIAAIGVAFAAYRPGGTLFFIFVAALGPVAVQGDLRKSAAIVLIAMLLAIGEWTLLRPFSYFPYIIAVEALLIGGATTFVARQQTAMRRIVKTVERERIARDLHDILGHTLSVIILKSELASRLIDRDAARAKQEIEEVERISRRALSEVREVIAGYRAGDFSAEIDRAKSTLATAGVAMESETHDVKLPISYERVLALVLREAVTNVVRHSQATRFWLELSQSSAALRLTLRDDGKGGDLREGMGMRGIRERVGAIGGAATWRTSPGTELIVTLPAPETGGPI